MEVQVKLEDDDPGDTPCRQAVVTAQSQSVYDQPSLDEMSRQQVALAPSTLAGPPMLWSSRDVRSWLEFCVKEYALRPVCVDKFDLNGKALLLLTRTDFIERAPHAGDILYNVFQRLIQQDGPGYLRSPIYLPTPAHFISPGAELLTRPLPAQSSRSVYIPIRPQPQAPICGSSHGSHTNSATCSASGSIVLSVDEENNSIGPGVPASMLSPALSEKCSSEADSANNESGHSPHGSDHEMDYDESMNFDPGRDSKYDLSDQNDDGVCRLLWEFIYQLLQDNKWSELVSWESVDDLTFRIQNPTNLADAWGKQKNRSNMTYEKLSRALRYYYKMNIIKKVQGKRLTYKFLQHPATIRKGQRGARPHSSKGLALRESETEPSSTEAITPDSSTFLPYCSVSTDLSSSTATPPSHDYSSHMASSKHEYISNKPPDINTAAYDSKETHFLSPSPDVKSSSQIQSSFILQEATSLGPSETTRGTSRPHSVSPGKHLLAMQKCQDRFCSGNEKRESSNHNAECRSQVTLLNTSPEINRWTLPRTEAHSKTIPSVSLISEQLPTGCNPMLPCPEEKPHFFAFSERNISRQQSDQELPKDKAGYFSPSGAQLYVPYSLKHMAPSQFCTTKNHDETVQSFIYSNDSFHRHHQYPNSYPRSFNHTSAHSSYAHEQPRPNQASPESYKRLQHNQQKDHIAAIFSNPAAVSARGAQDPFHIKRTVKQESYDLEQEEPEDLSMKQTLGKNGLGKKVKSESDIPLVSSNKDVNRDSPRSCSADSAYGSDRAEFGKDVSTDEFQE